MVLSLLYLLAMRRAHLQVPPKPLRERAGPILKKRHEVTLDLRAWLLVAEQDLQAGGMGRLVRVH